MLRPASTRTLALTLTLLLAGTAHAETAREKQHRTYTFDEKVMAREHQIEMDRKSGKLTRDEAIKLKKELLEKAAKEREKQ